MPAIGQIYTTGIGARLVLGEPQFMDGQERVFTAMPYIVFHKIPYSPHSMHAECDDHGDVIPMYNRDHTAANSFTHHWPFLDDKVYELDGRFFRAIDRIRIKDRPKRKKRKPRKRK